MFRKDYDQELDRSVGDPAKDKIKAKFTAALAVNCPNWTLEDNSKANLGLPDLIVRNEKGEPVYYYEPESKSNWSGGAFPYETVHVPGRKHKYIEAVGPNSLSFVIVSKDGKEYLKVRASKLVRTIQKTNKFSKGNLEPFLEFNVSDCEFGKF